jgi:hypothetical protein
MGVKTAAGCGQGLLWGASARWRVFALAGAAFVGCRTPR